MAVSKVRTLRVTELVDTKLSFIFSTITLQCCQPSMRLDLPLLSSTNLQWNKLAGVLAYLQGQMAILQAQVILFATFEGMLPVLDTLMLECHRAGTGALIAPTADVPQQHPGP